MASKPKHKKIDPIAILRAIAADSKAGSTARVQACRALIAYERDNADPEKAKDGAPTDQITQRALRLLRGGKA